MLSAGQSLQGRYNIIQFVSQGGMAAVYLGADTRLGNRHVAVKEMNPANLPPSDQQWAITAFQQEAQVLAGLNHPAIARVVDFFQEGPFWYLVMEYVAGEALDAALHRFPRGLAEEQVLNWASQLGSALDYLHQQYPPVIFRDLKPGNVMVQPDGTLKLIDFGIARYFKPGQNQDTLRLGTPGYAAPEQYGRGQTDARSDVYSFGVLLHQLLTGYDPALTPMNLPAARTLRPDISPRVAQAVEQAMRADPSQRYASVREFAAALGISISGVLGPPPPPAPPSPSLTERLKALPPLALLGLGAFVFTFLFLLGWFIFSLRGAEPTAVASADLAANPAVNPIIVEVTQVVTPTPNATENEPETPPDSGGASGSLPDATKAVEVTPTETAVPPTETAVPPTPIPTNTAVPPTDTPRPAPTFTPEPTRTPTPAVASCSYSATNSFANTYQSFQSQLGCPTGNAWNSWSAKEPFERGYMFWQESTDKIYVLYNNGNWARYDDIWVEGDPEFSCGTQQSPPTPKRGFGKIWCTKSGVQAGLGNATAGESGEDTTMQAFANGFIWQTSLGRYVLYNDGTWRR